MSGQDEVGLTGHKQSSVVFDLSSIQLVQFLAQGDGVNNYSVADEVFQSRAEDARGHRVEYKLLSVKDEGVPSIGAALETGDDIVLGGKDVYNFSFAFVSPLET
jgi:hypothetical protein